MTDIPNLNQLRYGTDPGRISEPDEGKKDVGFVTREAPSPTNYNWLQNKVFKRLKSLQGGENHIVVGDAAEQTNEVADLLIAELIDSATENGDKIVFLNGTHTLAGNKILNDHDLELRSQTFAAVIDLNGYTLTLNGDRLRGEINIINSASNSVVITGGFIESLKIRLSRTYFFIT